MTFFLENIFNLPLHFRISKFSPYRKMWWPFFSRIFINFPWFPQKWINFSPPLRDYKLEVTSRLLPTHLPSTHPHKLSFAVSRPPVVWQRVIFHKLEHSFSESKISGHISFIYNPPQNILNAGGRWFLTFRPNWYSTYILAYILKY